MTRKILIGLAAVGALLTFSAAPASADPITCPPGQVATVNPSDGGWSCVNNGGNLNDSGKTKNPND
jgi:hypothetical protein